MGLRVLLVTLVVAMGLELPKAADLAGWNQSACDWVSARVADLSGPGGREVPALATTEASPTRSDLVFEAVSEATALEFATDLARHPTRPTVESVVVSVEPAPEVPVTPVSSAPRIDRIAEAVRLTRQAVDAWTSLIQPTGDRSSETSDSVDSF